MKLIVNGFDIAPLCVQDSIQQSEIQRQTRSVVSLDGNEYRAGVRKRGISVSLGLIRDDVFSALLSAVTRPNLVQVEYTDMEKGDIVRVFYASELSGAVKVVHNGVTYWSGGSFTLEEK